MKKIALSLLPIVIALAVMFTALGLSISAQDSSAEASIPDDTLITYGFLESYKEQLKQEILAEIEENGGASADKSGYSDISLNEGQMILLSPDSEIIFRGGCAVAITSACTQGEGITDISIGDEIFSGMPLKFGHIYHPTESDSKKAVLVTGETAYFTLRGSYGIV